MSQEILINWSPQESRVAVVEYGAVQELHVERSLERGLVGNVYLGKVARVLPGMQSAFIDIGLDRAAFLHVADLMSSINSRHADADAAKGNTPAAAPPEPDPRLEALLAALDTLDPDALTPRDALQRLYELKALSAQRAGGSGAKPEVS